MGNDWFRCGGMFDGERLIAVSLAEKCGDTLIVHIEKAIYSYTGVYPAMVQAFARAFSTDVEWIDREDDAADRGLRTSSCSMVRPGWHPNTTSLPRASCCCTCPPFRNSKRSG